MSNEKNISGTTIDSCPIKKHSAKSWFAALLLGVFFGLAVIIPGVRGSTIAIIFGFYAGMLYGLGNILNDFKRCFAFLLPIGIGAIFGFGVGFILLKELFELYVFQVVCLFVGLMIGAVPALTKEIKGEKISALRIILFIVGIIIPLAIGAVSIILMGTDTPTATYQSFPVSRVLAYLPLGFAVAITQVVPGLSATAILMAFGQFRLIYNAIDPKYLLENPKAILLLAALGIGFVVGIICVSRIFSAIIKRHKGTAFYMVVGLSFGSIASMFLNTDVYAVYTGWAKNGVSIPTVAIGALLLAIGFVGSFLLTRYELSHQ